MPLRVVVIGGLGNFGARIVRRLALEAAIEVVATTRRAARQGSGDGGGDGGGDARVVTPLATLDIDSPDLAHSLAALAPDLVIHCAGPFQHQDYRVALATLAAGAHYVDLADGREFVAAFAASVDLAARAAGRFAITGASTLPALSTAVIDRYRESFASLEEIDIVIAPGQRAPRGRATIAAVLGYAGRPFKVWRDGAWRIVHGWQDLEPVRFSFGRRLAAACDVPDLQLLPLRYPPARSVSFRAALEFSLQHRVLWLIAAIRRAGVALPVARWGMAFERAAGWLDRFGGDTGGMRVRLRGRDRNDRPQALTWELVARGNQGPEIPAMAAVLLALRLAQGRTPRSGAQACMGILDLADFESEFERWSITTSVAYGA
jgi:saccharopine dehydrogenase-like NADP-dependent oxidoreductase